MKPPKSILDRTFKYRSAATTDVRATFDRIRREIKRRTEEQQAETTVVSITSRKAAR